MSVPKNWVVLYGLADIRSASPGQNQVEEDDSRAMFPDSGQGFVAVGCGFDGEPFFPEDEVECPGDVGLVVYDENVQIMHDSSVP
jgi:hypothetical protein